MVADWKTTLGIGVRTLDTHLGETWTLSGTQRVGRWGRVQEEVIATDQGTIRNAIRTLTVRKLVYAEAIAAKAQVTHTDGSIWTVRGTFSEDSVSRTYELLKIS